MADKTAIEWTEATWNPVTGCNKVSSGCKHCYAERDWARLAANPATRYFNRDFTDVQAHGDVLSLPLRWTKPRRIFVNSMSDLFHVEVSDEFIANVFAVMAACPRHTFQVLTKRPDRMLDLLGNKDARWIAQAQQRMTVAGVIPPRAYIVRWPLPNVWIGVSVEDQEAADERIPLLLQTPAAVRWISAEPLLGNLNVAPYLQAKLTHNGMLNGRAYINSHGTNRLDWVVVGGESGPKARPMHPHWARSLRDQCAAADVPFLFKQWGEHAPYDRGAADGASLASPNSLDTPVQRFGKKLAGRLFDGVEHNGYPEAPR